MLKLFRILYDVLYDAIWHFLEDDGFAMASHVALSTLLAVFPFLIFGAALANAFYHATGVRVRNYPISLDTLLPGLPDVG